MNEHLDNLPMDKPPEVRIMAMPANTNAAGDVFGGWLMSQVDIAGSIQAINRAGGRVVTVAVNEFTFIKPVFVGDLVSIYARLIKTGRSSMQVAVEAYAQRHSGLKDCHKIATATITYVAIGKDRRPVPLPPA